MILQNVKGCIQVDGDDNIHTNSENCTSDFVCKCSKHQEKHVILNDLRSKGQHQHACFQVCKLLQCHVQCW